MFRAQRVLEERHFCAQERAERLSPRLILPSEPRALSPGNTAVRCSVPGRMQGGGCTREDAGWWVYQGRCTGQGVPGSVPGRVYQAVYQEVYTRLVHPVIPAKTRLNPPKPALNPA